MPRKDEEWLVSFKSFLLSIEAGVPQSLHTLSLRRSPLLPCIPASFRRRVPGRCSSLLLGSGLHNGRRLKRRRRLLFRLGRSQGCIGRWHLHPSLYRGVGEIRRIISRVEAVECASPVEGEQLAACRAVVSHWVGSVSSVLCKGCLLTLPHA